MMTFTEVTGKEKYKTENLNNGGVRFDETKQDALKSAYIFRMRGATDIRILENGSTILEWHYSI